MGALEPIHLIAVLVIVLLIFGPGKLPQLARAIGASVREFKSTTRESQAPGAAVVSRDTCPRCATSLGASDRFCGACGAAAALS